MSSGHSGIAPSVYEIKNFAVALGFELFGIAKPVLREDDFENLRRFIENRSYLNMEWYGRTKEIRLHPERYLEGAKSVIVIGYVYRSRTYDHIRNSKVRISRYAIGKDYHKVFKKKLKILERFLISSYPGIKTKITVDSAPVPEKILARYAGIGWQGKNTNIIHPQFGSYFFIGTVFTDYDFHSEWESPEIPDHCRGCNLCLRSCPTGALQPYRLDVAKCISYWTIESREVLPDELAERSNWVFGCDVCQEVCPYNRRKLVEELETKEKDFRLREEIRKIASHLPTKEEWMELKNSPLKRVPFEIFERNYKKILEFSKEA